MNTFRLILLLIRRAFLWLFLFYWACFIGATTVKLIEGGPTRALALVKYIGTWVVSGEESGGRVTFVIHELSWPQFLAGQITYLAITLALLYPEWRSWRHKRQIAERRCS
jgi:hypothetical protein